RLVLRLYRRLMREGVPPERLRFFQSFLAGVYASDMDAPERRLSARVTAEIQGLPEDYVETYAARIKAVTPDEVAAAIKKHVHADDLAITMVASADEVMKLLLKAGIEATAIDIVPFDSY